MTHLDDETLLAAGSAAGRPMSAGQRAHLASCDRCAGRVAATAHLAAAARAADEALTGPIFVPSFGTLLGTALSARRGAGPVADPVPVVGPAAIPASVPGRVPMARPAATSTPAVVACRTPGAGPRRTPGTSLRRALRLAFQVVAAQNRLVPRALSALTAVGLITAVGLAYAVPDEGWRGTAFGAIVSLLVLTGALAACTPGADPRREFMMVLPVSPRVVFLARLVLVLAAEMAAALLASVAAGLLDRPGAAAELVSTWLGPSLLSASVAVVVSIWRTHWLGGSAGILVWFLGVAATLPQRRVPSVGVGAVLDQVCGNTPVSLLCAVVLLAAAVRLVSDSRPAFSDGN